MAWQPSPRYRSELAEKSSGICPLKQGPKPGFEASFPKLRSDYRRQIVRRLAAAILSILVTGEVTCAESKSRLIEVKDEFQTYAGKIIAKDSERCFLMDKFGVLTTHHISRLTSFRIVGDSFHRVSPSEFRKQLLTEFQSGYDIHLSTHYVVVGKKGEVAAV